MSEVDSERVAQMMPKAGCWFMGIPVLAVPVVFVGYAVMVWVGVAGRPADGPLVELRFEGCEAAMPLIAQRAQAMGLGELQLTPNQGGATLRARLPSDPDVAAAVPLTLAKPGRISVRDDADERELIGPEQVTGAAIRMDISTTPAAVMSVRRPAAEVLVAHLRAHPEGTISFYVDGERVDGRRNTADFNALEIEFTPHSTRPRRDMELAAEWSIIADHPLPCAVQLLGSEQLSE